MALQKIQLRPGIFREGTNYSNQGGWYDCNKIRFRAGLPEKMRGWQKSTTNTFLGTARSLLSWSTLTGQNYIGVGTSDKYYTLYGGTYTDITPIRRTVTLASGSMASTVNTKNVVITDNANGASIGDYVTITGATGFAGIPTGDLNKEFKITAVSTNTITIVVATSATSTTTGGGTPTLNYQISVGLNTSVTGDGWGAGPWSRNAWGSSYGDITITSSLRLWSNDNFGQDLVINVRDGGIYYSSAASIAAGSRAVVLTSLAGANSTPTIAREIVVSGATRNLIAFSCQPYGANLPDPMIIRWCASESLTDWQPREDNDAGDIRMATGTSFVTQIHTKQEIVVWTDISMYALRYIGAPFTFGLTQIGYGTSIIAPNAKASVNDTVYWMGENAFYTYNGRIDQLPCSVKDYVFSNMNMAQSSKITCGSNISLGEVIWFYPSATSQEVDSYVTYNYFEKVWYFGTLVRTVWLDFAQNGLPIATGTDGCLYNHEVGNDDGSTDPPTAINAYIESSPFEIGDGDSFAFVRQVFPDLTFRDTNSNTNPSATFTLKMRNYPGAGISETQNAATTRTAVLPVEQFTEQLSLRLRGRSAVMRIESGGLGVAWRLGVPRFEMRTDGRR